MKASESVGRVYSPIGTGLVKPVAILSPVGTSELEADAARGVVGVQDLDGVRDLRIRDVSAGNVFGLVDHMPCKTNRC